MCFFAYVLISVFMHVSVHILNVLLQIYFLSPTASMTFMAPLCNHLATYNMYLLSKSPLL